MLRSWSCFPSGPWNEEGPISATGARIIGKLIHETDKAEEIKKSGFLSSMSQFGGANFSVTHRGGYRPKANALVTLDGKNLAIAVDAGYGFF